MDITRDHHIQCVIGDIYKEVTTRRSLNKISNFMAFVSQIQVKGIDEDIVN